MKAKQLSEDHAAILRIVRMTRFMEFQYWIDVASVHKYISHRYSMAKTRRLLKELVLEGLLKEMKENRRLFYKSSLVLDQH